MEFGHEHEHVLSLVLGGAWWRSSFFCAIVLSSDDVIFLRQCQTT